MPNGTESSKLPVTNSGIIYLEWLVGEGTACIGGFKEGHLPGDAHPFPVQILSFSCNFRHFGSWPSPAEENPGSATVQHAPFLGVKKLSH